MLVPVQVRPSAPINVALSAPVFLDRTTGPRLFPSRAQLLGARAFKACFEPSLRHQLVLRFQRQYFSAGLPAVALSSVGHSRIGLRRSERCSSPSPRLSPSRAQLLRDRAFKACFEPSLRHQLMLRFQRQYFSAGLPVVALSNAGHSRIGLRRSERCSSPSLRLSNVGHSSALFILSYSDLALTDAA